jgi:CRP-like cAMP-binding protein
MVLLDKLEDLTFCKGMPQDYLRRLVSAGQMKDYPAGAYLFREGVHSSEVYLLVAGQVALEASLPCRDPIRIQTVGLGELLGWSPLMGLGYMTASGVALTPCQVLALDVGQVLTLAREDPPFGLEFMQRVAVTLARRLNATRIQLLQAYPDEAQVVS